MEWTREKTLLLINEYKSRRGLWDMTHDDYRKKDIKHKLLCDVSNSLGGGIPINEIEKKFHTLRTQFHREINRMKRKEPYNSKWFGFRTLQFLNSPKACRTTKARIRAEITDEGTVQKYEIKETSSSPANSSSEMNNSQQQQAVNDEFITLHRKPTITYHNSRSANNELEKLIEETTKDVDEIDETKPKMPDALAAHAYSTHEITVQPQAQSQTHEIMESDEVETIASIEMQHNDEGISYHTTSNSGTAAVVHTSAITSHHGHHQIVPQTIIKVQRRNTQENEDDYYEEQQQQPATLHHAPQPATQHQLHALANATTTKRIYYDNGGVTTFLTTAPTSTSPSNNNSAASSVLLGTTHKISAGQQQQTAQIAARDANNSTTTSTARDEYSIYGEYIGNEMRSISNREILISLKHKINTAIYEANLADLQNQKVS